ncbi:HAMP domain-containing histidine kinase [Kovacikia minuta CCNUW1]|uniref:sensor histidine kinase n=1 Tax=Kovacikia minuta TaxID=2931930 RepID=UPI001CCDC83C|nr:HAMP domain-containing sensor histidine kinase [Kovacikia minuta]UBF25710.1 HAMP domain-containing histidine kinase [Kovacikia minuta CCNUW1]
MRRPGLRSRLFLSHLTVMIVGLSTLLTVSKVFTPRLFVLHLQKLEGRGFNLYLVREQLVEGFEFAWSRGAFWSVAVGGSAAGWLSYLVSKRIMQPLIRIEEVTQKVAAGNLEERLPNSDIPELNRLSISFNRMAANLEGVEQRRRELVGDLTHELRTPLTVLEGYLEGLADGTIEPSVDIYQRLAKETGRLHRLVNDLQELSQAEAGYLPIRSQPLEVRPLLAALVQKFSDQLLEEGPSLVLDCPSDLPLALADPERVEQVLMNLMGNALRYTSEGSITIRAWSEIGKLWISVTDTGHGIAPEDLPHIFERFWRSDRSRDRHSGGTGIGLAISRRLVELQGGSIEVESKLGQGSIFRFWLPLA